MSDSLLIPLIIAIFCVGFPLLWFLVTRLVMALAGLSRNVDASSLGEFVAFRGTGSARIGGMNFSGVLTLDRYENGYLFSLPWIFGSGKLVLLDDEIKTVSSPGGSFARSSVIERTDGRGIRLFGQLADTVAHDFYAPSSNKSGG